VHSTNSRALKHRFVIKIIISIIIVTYKPGAEQRPLSKQLYDQSLLDNKSANNNRCHVTVALRKRNDVFCVVRVTQKLGIGFCVRSVSRSCVK
jgi:hypothetical protein